MLFYVAMALLRHSREIANMIAFELFFIVSDR